MMTSAATTLNGSSSGTKFTKHNEKNHQGTVQGDTNSTSATATATTAATRTTQTTTQKRRYHPSCKILSKKNERKLRRKIRIAEDTLQYMTAGLFFL